MTKRQMRQRFEALEQRIATLEALRFVPAYPAHYMYPAWQTYPPDTTSSPLPQPVRILSTTRQAESH